MGSRNKGFSREYLEMKITPHVSKPWEFEINKLINGCESVSSVMKSFFIKR